MHTHIHVHMKVISGNQVRTGLQAVHNADELRLICQICLHFPLYSEH